MSDSEADRKGAAAKHALELMKQIITLASGVLALSATFISHVPTENWLVRVLIAVAWLSLTLAVFFSLQTISSIVRGSLDPDFDWSEGYGRRAAALGKYFFVAGLAAFAIFAFLTVVLGGTPRRPANESSNKALAPVGYAAGEAQDRWPASRAPKL